MHLPLHLPLPGGLLAARLFLRSLGRPPVRGQVTRSRALSGCLQRLACLSVGSSTQ